MRGRRAFRRFWWKRGPPGFPSVRRRRKWGWHTQATRQVILENCRVPAANRLGPEGTGFKIAMAGAGWRAAEYRRVFAGRRAGSAGSDGGVYGGAAGVRPSAGPVSGVAVSACRYGDGAGGWRGRFCGVPRRRWMPATSMATQLCAMAKRFVTDTGFEVANQALQLHGGYGVPWPIMAWRRLSVICACIRSWKGRTKSCG